LTAHNELRTDSWRHLAFQLDGNANELRIFLDGAFAASTPSTDLAAGKVRAMIDQTGVMAVGHSFPGFTYEAETFVADYRLYTTALDAAQVYTLAFEPSSLGTPGSGLCAPTVQLVDDGSWTDFLGNSCSWYRCGSTCEPVGQLQTLTLAAPEKEGRMRRGFQKIRDDSLLAYTPITVFQGLFHTVAIALVELAAWLLGAICLDPNPTAYPYGRQELGWGWMV
jgi:hypothetical protein